MGHDKDLYDDPFNDKTRKDSFYWGMQPDYIDWFMVVACSFLRTINKLFTSKRSKTPALALL